MDILAIPSKFPQFGRSTHNIIRPSHHERPGCGGGCGCGGATCTESIGEALGQAAYLGPNDGQPWGSAPSWHGLPDPRERNEKQGDYEEPSFAAPHQLIVQNYCCCVKGMKVEAEGSKMVDEDPKNKLAGKRPTNLIKVKVKVEMRPSEKPALCAVEWFEHGSTPADKYQKPKGKPHKPAWGEGKWNASHTRTSDGRRDQRRFEAAQEGHPEVLAEYEAETEGFTAEEIAEAGLSAPSPWLRGADDAPYGGVARNLDVLVVAKSGCPGCVSCCAWLRYSYGAKAIDVTVLGAGCGKKCDGIANDYKKFEPFKNQLPKPPKGQGKLSSGKQGGSYEVSPQG